MTLSALLYLVLSDPRGLHHSMYFSLASYTAMGAGERKLPDDHRLLSAVEAAVGILMFGWSTALLAALVIRDTSDGSGDGWLPPQHGSS